MANRHTGDRDLRVGIVGGSIAGCAVAIELARAGYAVSVFERSRGALVGRGAGIGTPMATLRSLVARDLLDKDFPYCRVTRELFIGCGSANERFGHTALALDRDYAMMHWGTLFRTLRRRVPNAIYHDGCTVIDAHMVNPETAVVRFDDGSEQSFDLVIFADGYRSLGRRLLFPDLEVQYCGYVAWRGVLDERLLTDGAPLESSTARVIYRSTPGHLTRYFVPGLSGSVAKGERQVNWVAFFVMPPEALPRFLTDRHGRQHTHSLPPGAMRPEEESRLKELAQAQLPPYYAEIVTSSRDTFGQPIYRVAPPAYHRGRICLIGDAGAVVQPMTGSGVFRGMTNAAELVTAMQAGDGLDTALVRWDEAQTAIGRQFIALGRQMEQALIWATPDLAQLDAPAVEDWWNRTVPLRAQGAWPWAFLPNAPKR